MFIQVFYPKYMTNNNKEEEKKKTFPYRQQLNSRPDTEIQVKLLLNENQSQLIVVVVVVLIVKTVGFFGCVGMSFVKYVNSMCGGYTMMNSLLMIFCIMLF